MTNKELCLAIDLGGTKISAALFDPDGGMHKRVKKPVDTSTPERPADQAAEIIGELKAEAGGLGAEVPACGICVPGVVYQSDGSVWAPNIPGWERFPLRSRLTQAAEIPLTIEADRSAYVMGESWQGAARGKSNVVFLAVGTGIGAGILIDGRIYHGQDDISGAVGWFALNRPFRPEYASGGCFETEASGSALAVKARRRIEEGAETSMLRLAGGDLSGITAETVVTAAREEDAAARDILQTAVDFLAMGIANIVSLLNPEMIVLGGGLFQAGEFITGPVEKTFKRWSQPLAAQNVRIELSRLGEDAGLYGAGKLAWDYFSDIRKD